MSKWDGAMYTIPSAEGRRNADGPTPTEGQYRTQRAELLAAIKTVKEGTTSDNLREALEAEVSNGPRLTAKTRSRLFESIGDVIDKYNLPVQNMGLRPDVAELGDICGDVETAVIAWLRAILAAHPDETTTEWGVRMDGEGALIEPMASNSQAITRVNLAAEVGVHCHAESRQVTPWKVAS